MPQFSNDWIRNFQSRRDIKRRTKYDEAGSLSEDAAIEMIGIRKALSLFAPQDILDCDEDSPLPEDASWIKAYLHRHYLVEKRRRRELVLSSSANPHALQAAYTFCRLLHASFLYKYAKSRAKECSHNNTRNSHSAMSS
jgi:hypothetical protein